MISIKEVIAIIDTIYYLNKDRIGEELDLIILLKDILKKRVEENKEDDNGSDILELVIDYKGRTIPAWVKNDIENEQKKKDVNNFLKDLRISKTIEDIQEELELIGWDKSEDLWAIINMFEMRWNKFKNKYKEKNR